MGAASAHPVTWEGAGGKGCSVHAASVLCRKLRVSACGKRLTLAHGAARRRGSRHSGRCMPVLSCQPGLGCDAQAPTLHACRRGHRRHYHGDGALPARAAGGAAGGRGALREPCPLRRAAGLPPGTCPKHASAAVQHCDEQIALSALQRASRCPALQCQPACRLHACRQSHAAEPSTHTGLHV